jgi:hypothetical protein
MIIDIGADPGLSGGAVTDVDGHIVGIVAAADPDTNNVVAYQVDEVWQRPGGGTDPC